MRSITPPKSNGKGRTGLYSLSLRIQECPGKLTEPLKGRVPFAADIRKATGLPVYSFRCFIIWFQSGQSWPTSYSSAGQKPPTW